MANAGMPGRRQRERRVHRHERDRMRRSLVAESVLTSVAVLAEEMRSGAILGSILQKQPIPIARSGATQRTGVKAAAADIGGAGASDTCQEALIARQAPARKIGKQRLVGVGLRSEAVKRAVTTRCASAGASAWSSGSDAPSSWVREQAHGGLRALPIQDETARSAVAHSGGVECALVGRASGGAWDGPCPQHSVQRGVKGLPRSQADC